AAISAACNASVTASGRSGEADFMHVI
ncbi:MAG: hypothetical protein JWR25_212, partial [Noviherbaspirillum sp.]|nr:hypothetical protein [Noviherbaspirillum sp.]